MKNIWIIANWKSNKTIAEALEWVSQVGPHIPKRDSLKIVVCPTFSCLSEVKKAVSVGGSSLIVGSQNLSPFEAGSYTGEESAQLLKDIIELSILGHSERRKNFSEDDQMISQKVQQAVENNITPLLCVQGPEVEVLGDVKLVAYEPIFAIGTGNPDTPENAEQVALKLKEKYGSGLEILYGGSVTSTNIKQFINQPNISGVLIGRASLDPQEFITLLQEVQQ